MEGRSAADALGGAEDMELAVLASPQRPQGNAEEPVYTYTTPFTPKVGEFLLGKASYDKGEGVFVGKILSIDADSQATVIRQLISKSGEPHLEVCLAQQWYLHSAHKETETVQHTNVMCYFKKLTSGNKLRAAEKKFVAAADLMWGEP